MKKTKVQSGITLVALIITIVVLLILAAVAIGAVKNSDIIGYANQAKTLFEETQNEEEEKLNEMKKEMLIGTDKESLNYNAFYSGQTYGGKIIFFEKYKKVFLGFAILEYLYDIEENKLNIKVNENDTIEFKILDSGKKISGEIMPGYYDEYTLTEETYKAKPFEKYGVYYGLYYSEEKDCFIIINDYTTGGEVGINFLIEEIGVNKAVVDYTRFAEYITVEDSETLKVNNTGTIYKLIKEIN